MENQTTRIFGLRAIIEAIQAGENLEKIYLQKEIKGELAGELHRLIREKRIAFSYVPVEKLNTLSKHQNHQGAVAVISSIEFSDLSDVLMQQLDTGKPGLFLLLDQISDVRNLGAILRTAECTGVDAVIIPTHGSAPVNAQAIKTSAGAAFRIPVCKVNHALDAVYELQAAGIQIVAVTEKTNQNFFDLNLKESLALVLGSEDRGVTPSILKAADQKGKLPLLGEIESLNVSVAGGVALYEVVRQRMQ